MRKTLHRKSHSRGICRRQFLRGAALLAPAAFLHRRRQPADAAAVPRPGATGTRYRETDHVRKYYEKADDA